MQASTQSDKDSIQVPETSDTYSCAFKVGDVVVYPTHGVGEITAEEIQVIAGTEMSLYVISTIKGNVKIHVPKTRASKVGLRHLSSETELAKAINVLQQSKSPSKKDNWPKRANKYGEKISSGNPTLIAEVVRDLHRNDENQGGVSYSERTLYETALERLVSEYAFSKGIDEKTAEKKIISVLKYKS
jgi:CarD family transcriptional regulator